ncbi:LRR domain containing protein [Parasponia andersonii]|uniref:LRR domain containing protein n=1 Tax=Parasponia andersonii TaxID=3476 RepID=A0A2P5E5B4_PARAD|nr:LRR domain containing protein [Parasponia andersonii]
MLESLNLGDNRLPDVFPSRLGTLPKLRLLILRSNRLHGVITNPVSSLEFQNLHSKGRSSTRSSNNILGGEILPSLGNLTAVESLELSRNKLCGEIPQRLVELTFLAFFNVSHNHLTGRIPRGTQLNTFENSSYAGNSGLCGDPLTKKCERSETSKGSSLSTFDVEEDSESPFLDFCWKTVVFVFGIGIPVGVIIENTPKTKK